MGTPIAPPARYRASEATSSKALTMSRGAFLDPELASYRLAARGTYAACYIPPPCRSGFYSVPTGTANGKSWAI